MLLHQNWTLTGTDGQRTFTADAVVPGCLHTDLIRAGIIGADLFSRDNAEKVQWLENCDVTYSCAFSLEAVEKDTFLTFDGLDCYADVVLNGVSVGAVDNMFIPWSFNVTDSLRAGENRLEVRFRSPVKEVADKPKRPGAFTTERLWTRRIQCTYGWDWVARFVTMGIWRKVSLDVKRPDSLGHDLDGVYVWTENLNPLSAQLGVRLDLESVSGDGWVEMSVLSPDGAVVWKKNRRILMNRIEERIDVVSPQLWFPVGLGAQPLYTLVCRTPHEEKRVTFGIRTIVLVEAEDAPDSKEAALAAKFKKYDQLLHWDRNEGSSSFIVLVNGVKIFCQGANWVPCEPFPSAETPEKIEYFVKMAAEGGVNMLRVWGGGIFENQAFYDACDRAGILVTQDFLMACGAYPEEFDEFIGQLTKETRSGALQLRNHPCLAWWSGDNENAVNGDENMPDYRGRRAALEGIAPVLAELDPKRRFLPSSPYGGVPYASATRGTTHNTQFLGDFFAFIRKGDFTNYQDYFAHYLARFCAEQPAIGMPFVSSMRRFMTDEDIFGGDTSISEYHTKNNPGLGAITLYGYVDRMARGMFGEYKNGADRVKKMQLLHGEWIRLSLELFRRYEWYSSGIIYWMFGDCWPAANGWSIVDYYGEAKPGYYIFKRCTKPVIASVTLGRAEEDGRAHVYLSNNGLTAADVRVRLYRYHLHTGAEDCVSTADISIPAQTSADVLTISLPALDAKTLLLCDVEGDGISDRAFALPMRWADMAWEDGEPVVTETPEAFRVTSPVTNPMTFIDPNGQPLDRNGLFLKKNETVLLNKIR